jgi:hypothetical protein
VVRRISHRRRECFADSARDQGTRTRGQTPEGRLARAAHRARVVDVVAQIRAAVDAGKNHAGLHGQQAGKCQHHAIGRGAVDRESGVVDPVDRERPFDRDALAARAPLPIGSHHHHIAEIGHRRAQGQKPGRPVTIVVCDQDERSGHPFSLSGFDGVTKGHASSKASHSTKRGLAHRRGGLAVISLGEPS